ncbi:MAG: hypothetical protein E7014_01575 [Alphaproteobacteria bacterium]|nr:hypothetical protein [Alphaproteobacteria bacterium]
MQTKINELGRSMVEMLGVLAIIGVLSVGGVATYQYALTAYQAGKVQDVLGKAKTLAQTDSRASHALEVNRFIKSALSEYTPDDKKSMVKLVDGNYQVTAFKMTHKICEKLFQKEGILNDMGISILTKTCGNPNNKTSMVFSFDATPTFESGSHFGGGNGGGNSGSGSSNLPDIDNPNIEPETCPDKMVWRQKEDGTYGCICRHEYEFGDNCERCYPPKEWFEDEVMCRCPDFSPIWKDEKCVECLTNDDCANPTPVCGTNNMCESCPTDKIHWDAITKMCTPCATSCPTGQIQDGETCVCYCDTSKYELEPNQNGECVCKTEDVVEMDIASTGINSSVWECRITTNNLGKLKGTYYFEWVDGYHYYNCKTKRVGFATYVFEGTKNLGYIINKDSDFVGNGEGYNVGTTKQVTNALRNQPIKYFTFNGLADITIQFWDNECDNNCGSMNFKLHKVVDYCLTE